MNASFTAARVIVGPHATIISLRREVASARVIGTDGPRSFAFAFSLSFCQSVDALMRVSGWRRGSKMKRRHCLMTRFSISSSVRSPASYISIMSDMAFMASWSSIFDGLLGLSRAGSADSLEGSDTSAARGVVGRDGRVFGAFATV